MMIYFNNYKTLFIAWLKGISDDCILVERKERKIGEIQTLKF